MVTDKEIRKTRILIVDDEPNVRFILERSLAREGYTLETAHSGAEAIKLIGKAAYDLILLDLQLGPVSGIQVLTELRKYHTDTVVIILTAHGTIDSAVEAIHLSAFDYLFKPASPETIRERVREGLAQRQAALRHARILTQIESLRQTLSELEVEEENLTPPESASRFVRSGKLVIDHHHRVATLSDHLLELTTAEFNILTCLVGASPKPVSSRQLVNRALGYDTSETEAREIVKWHIHHLRRKIEPNPKKPCHIKTLRYEGYLWSG